MSDDFDEHASVELKTKHIFKAKNDLLTELYRQKRESLNHQNRSTLPDETQNLNLKFDKAKEKIKQEMISSDSSSDNSVLYTAMTNFKKKRV